MFRKVAAWYAKALRFQKKVQHRLTMLSSLAEFDEAIAPFAEAGPPEWWTEWDAQAAAVPLPAGPIAHW
jgi:hypothetical protein